MKKLITFILAAMMLMLCGCGDRGSQAASSDASGAGESLSKEFTKWGITLYLPEDTYEKDAEDGSYGSSTDYECKRGRVRLSKLSFYNENWHSGAERDSFLSFVDSYSGSIQNVTFNDTSAAMFDMTAMIESKEFYTRGLVFNLSGNSMQMFVTSFQSQDDTKAFFSEIMSSMKAEGKSVNVRTSVSAPADRTSRDEGMFGIFTKKVTEGAVSFCVPLDADRTITSSGSKAYEGTEAVIMSSELSDLPDLNSDSELYQIFKTFDFERMTVRGVTILKVITTSEGKYYGWVVFNLSGVNHTIGVTSKIDAVSYMNVKGLLDDFAETISITF